MTAAELNKQIGISEQPKQRTGRAYRRMMNERKFKRLHRIVTSSYVPHAGYS